MTTRPETIRLHIEHRRAWITLDRPPLNILNIAMMKSLDAALERALPKSDTVIFQGAGVRAFCAGADVAEDRKSTRLNSSHGYISYAVFCLKKKNNANPSAARGPPLTHGIP